MTFKTLIALMWIFAVCVGLWYHQVNEILSLMSGVIIGAVMATEEK